MSKDYEDFRNSIVSEVNSASITARAASGRLKQKFRITNSELPSLVPVGAEIEVEPIVFTKLKAGDVIYVRYNGKLSLKRYIKLKMTASNSYLTVTEEGSKEAEVLPKGCLVGKVVQASYKGKSYDPSKQGPVQGFINLLTEYGTHTPFSGLLRLVQK